MNRFWKFSNSADDSAELLFYGPISETSWWGDEVTPKQFNSDLEDLGDVASIKVRINSPGGDVFAAAAIYNALRNHPATITTYVDGLAASAASVVAMAGDDVVMPVNAMMMIHNPSSGVWGDAGDMRATADVLDKVRDSILAAYVAKTGKGEDELKKLMDSETWMTAAEAVGLGFADRVDTDAHEVTASIAGRLLVVNGLGFGMDRFRTIPTAFANAITTVTTTGDIPTANAAGATTQEANPMSDNLRIIDEVAEPVADETPEVTPEETPEEMPVVVTDEAETIRAQERERIRAIESLSVPGAEDAIKAAIDEGLTVEAAALKILQSEGVRAQMALAARAQDAATTGTLTGGAVAPVALTDEVISNMTPDERKSRWSEIQNYYAEKRNKKARD